MKRQAAEWLADRSCSTETWVRIPAFTVFIFPFSRMSLPSSWAGPCAGLTLLFFLFFIFIFSFLILFFSYLLFKLFRDFNNLKVASFQKKCLRNHKNICEFKTKFCRFKCLENHKKFADSKIVDVFAKLFTKL